MIEHAFGGSWTEQKLQRVKLYLSSYLCALKNQRFTKIYIDAFAGTGYRSNPDSACEVKLPFDDEELNEIAAFRDGSAKIALQFDPGFDKYIFIEKVMKKCDELEKLRLEYPQKADAIEIIRSDANTALTDICCEDTDWGNKRVVIFLDPYGLQVDWNTLRCIARINGIDLWYLFPIGAVLRLLPKKREVCRENSDKLDVIFGTHEWYDAFYKERSFTGLFDDNNSDILREANVISVTDLIVKRLESIFSKVSRKPAVLRNTKKNSPMFLLCFAMTNSSRKAIDLAMRLADYVLEDRNVKNNY